MTEPITAAPAPPDETQVSPEREFVNKVLALERGKRAVLKRNAGNTLAEARGCYWFYHLLPTALRRGERTVETCFLLATLMSTVRNPERARDRPGGLGAAMADLAARSASSEAVGRRFGMVLDARFEPWTEGGGELPFRLRQLVRLADSQDVALPWVSLLRDLLRWDHPRKFVQKQWAAEFYTGDRSTGGSATPGAAD
jgi:CRISPR type I-E-associated protein CasB/Cse2